MKTLVSIFSICALPLIAVAQQYDNIGAFGRVTPTIAAGSASNVLFTVNATRYGEFALEIRYSIAGTSTTGPSIAWETSADGRNWCTAVDGSGKGWFALPSNLGTAGATNTWVTNITVGAVGYWRIAWMTNGATQTLTNVGIRAWGKPNRFDRR